MTLMLELGFLTSLRITITLGQRLGEVVLAYRSRLNLYYKKGFAGFSPALNRCRCVRALSLRDYGNNAR